MTRILPAISFIGGGNMATAMIGGLLNLPERGPITVSEPDEGKRAALAARGCVCVDDNDAAVQAGDVVVLAIKPQLASQVVSGLARSWRPGKVLVSILAGMTSARLAGWLPPESRIIRAMPNTPLAIGRGMVGICRGRHASAADLEQACALFAPCAQILRLEDEARMDAITAVSGSGPAYVFAFAEALHAAAMNVGFTQDEAALLVGQTVAGSWQYLLDSGFAARRLREQVTSPGGTTAAALGVLSHGDFQGLLVRAVQAAQVRGRELAGS